MGFESFILSQRPLCEAPDCLVDSAHVINQHDNERMMALCEGHFQGWERPNPEPEEVEKVLDDPVYD